MDSLERLSQGGKRKKEKKGTFDRLTMVEKVFFFLLQNFFLEAFQGCWYDIRK